MNLRVTAEAPRSAPDTTFEAAAADGERVREAYFDGERRRTRVRDRRTVPVDARVEGPTILEQAESTTVVPPDWAGTVQPDGTMVLERGQARKESNGGTHE